MKMLSDPDILNTVTHLPVVQSLDARTQIITAARQVAQRRLAHYPARERVQTTLYADLLAPHVDVLVTARQMLVDFDNKRWATVWMITLWLPGPEGPYEACRVTQQFMQDATCFQDPDVPVSYILSAFQRVEEPVN